MEEVAKLRGLPWACTVEDIMDFFGPDCDIIDGKGGIHLVKTLEGKSTGEAFVELKSEEDLYEALKKDKKTMGHRYVEVFKVKRTEMDWILKRTRPLAQPPHGSGSGSSSGDYRDRDRDKGRSAYGFQADDGGGTFVRLRGLPYEVTKDDIAQFFDGLEVAHNGIQLVVDEAGRTTGEAYTRFATREMAEEALLRDRQSIGHRYVELFRVSPHEMRTIDMLVERTNRHSYSIRSTPYDRSSRDSQRSRSSRYGNRDSGSSRYSDDGWNSSYDDSSWSRRGTRGPSGSSSSSRSLSRGSRQRNNSGIKVGSCDGDYSLLMRGLPYRASEEDIHKFFDPIDVVGIHIIYDETIRPSGTAKAYFSSKSDLNEAMGKHKERMDHRYIELFED